jgi:hypothetical protein
MKQATKPSQGMKIQSKRERESDVDRFESVSFRDSFNVAFLGLASSY